MPPKVSWKLNLAMLWFSQLVIFAGFQALIPFVPLFIKNELGITDKVELAAAVTAFNFFGTFAYAIFNVGESDAKISLDFGSESSIRDVWAKENLTSTSAWTHASVKHSVRVVRCSSKADKISAESI